MLHVVYCVHGARLLSAISTRTAYKLLIYRRGFMSFVACKRPQLLPAIRTSTLYKLLIYRICFISSNACTVLDYYLPSAGALLKNC